MTGNNQGEYKIVRQDNILVVDAHGVFDATCTQQYMDDMYLACDQFEGKPWGLLVTFHDKNIFTPDAEIALIDVTKYRMEKGMIANASVLLQCSTAEIQQMQLRRIYQACRLTFHVFGDTPSAKNWLSDYVAQQTPLRATSRQ